MRIAVMLCGGTALMAHDSAAGGATLAGAGDAPLLGALDTMGDEAQFHIIRHSQVPSPHMGPTDMAALAGAIDQQASLHQLDAVVVVQGTDTLEETAFACELLCRADIPVVFTGALRCQDDYGYDGGYNLRAAVAFCKKIAGQGRLIGIAMADHLYSAVAARKMHSSSICAFAAEEMPMAAFRSGKVHLGRDFHPRLSSRPDCVSFSGLMGDVPILFCASGDDGRMAEAAIRHDVDGLVCVAMGAGNLAPAFAGVVSELLVRGVPVVVSTRCPYGGSWPIYAYEGGGAWLDRRGAILARACCFYTEP